MGKCNTTFDYSFHTPACQFYSYAYCFSCADVRLRGAVVARLSPDDRHTARQPAHSAHVQLASQQRVMMKHVPAASRRLIPTVTDHNCSPSAAAASPHPDRRNINIRFARSLDGAHTSDVGRLCLCRHTASNHSSSSLALCVGSIGAETGGHVYPIIWLGTT